MSLKGVTLKSFTNLTEPQEENSMLHKSTNHGQSKDQNIQKNGMNAKNGVHHTPEALDTQSGIKKSGSKVDFSNVDIDLSIPEEQYEKPFTGADENSEDSEVIDVKVNAKVSFFQLFRFADKLDKLLIVLGTLAAVLNGAIYILNIVVYGRVIDIFVSGAYRSMLSANNLNFSTLVINSSFETNTTTFQEDNVFNLVTKECYNFCFTAVATLIAGFIQMSCWVLTAERQAHTIRNRFFHSVLQKHIGWFDKQKIGELTTTLSDDTVTIQNGIGDKLAIFMQWTSTFITGISIGFSFGWKLTLVVIALSPLIILSASITAVILRRLTLKELKVYGSAGAVAEEVLSSIHTVAAFGGESKEVDRYSEKLLFANDVGLRKGFFVGLASGFFWVTVFGLFGLSMWYGTEQVRVGDYTGGQVMQVFLCVMIGLMSLGQALPNIESITLARTAAAKLYDIIDIETEIDPFSNKGLQPDKLHGNIKFEEVYFTYPSRQDVQILNGITFEVDMGQKVAIVGPSGCGKSTIVHLLQRFYNVDGGKVKIGDYNIKDLNTHWIRKHIGVVSQEPVLFNTTIANNIKYGMTGDVTQSQIEQAAREANAHDFIQQLPEKYDTLVGERGAQLSGGQKQRVAIARALVSDPTILLLDEATSALDTESEGIVQEALEKASKGRTTIVIAHRLSTIENVDKIIAIDCGEIDEVGTHEELMKTDGLYYHLVKNQQNMEEEDEEEGNEFDDINKVTMEEKFGHLRGSYRRSNNSQNNSKSGDIKLDEDSSLQPASVKRILRMNSSEWPVIIIGCVFAIINGSIMPIFASILSEIIGNFAQVDPEKQSNTIRLWSCVIAGIGLVTGVVALFQNYCFTVAGEKLTLRVRKMTFSAMLKQEMSWFDDPKHTVGALTTRLASDASLIRGAAGPRVGFTLQALATIATALTIAFIYSWKLALVVLGFFPFLIVAGLLQGKMVEGLNKSNSYALEEGGRIANDALQNIRTVASLCREQTFEELHSTYFSKIKKKAYSATILFGITYGSSQCILFLCYAASLTFGSWLVYQGQHDFIAIFKVFTAITIGGVSLGRASAFGPDFGKAKIAAAHVFAIIDKVSTIDPSNQEGLKPENYNGELEFRKVVFTYPSRPKIKVLQELNLKVLPGQTLALIGSSGCGKSTIVQLIERFYEVTQGHITLGKNKLTDLNIKWLRSQIGIVSQEPVLFDVSIADNISYGDNSRDIPMTDIINAAKRANIHSFVESLPMGYETTVGSKGGLLSGGQKQRIAIARALIRNPKILLLDEATSALDTESEKIVQSALDEASYGRTCIVIAHRLSTIQEADHIVAMKHGHVIEQGTHDELIAEKGFYALLKRRKSSYAISK